MRWSSSLPSPLTFGTLTLAAALALGCGGPSVGEITSQQVTLTLKGIASEPSVAAIGAPDGGLGVKQAWLRSSGVTFEACRSGVADLVLEPRAYDLASEPAPSEAITTAVDELCGLRVDIEPAGLELDGVPENATLYVEATNDDGDELTFQSDAPTSLVFRTKAAESFGSEPLLLGVDVSKWLADIPLEAEEAEAAGERLLDQLRGASALYVDANGNGRLDDAELGSALSAEP